MNPRAGDTVTSTKATTSTTTMTSTTTTITTTGERSGRTANVVAAAVRPSAKAGGTPTTRTRKRRQQAEEEPRLQKPQQPPVKSRRRAESSSKSREQSAAKSRLGDFFTSLASSIRGRKSADITAIGGSLENRRVGSDSVLAQSSTKGDSSNEHTLYKHNDHTKRRKIERDVCDKKCESAAASESPKVKDRAIEQTANTSNINSENQKLPSDGDSSIVKNIEYTAGEKTKKVGQTVAKSTSFDVKQTQDSKQSESAGKLCKIVKEKKDPPKKEQKLDSETKEHSETAAKESKIAEEKKEAPKENEKDSETKEQSDVAARKSKIVEEEKDPAKVDRKTLSFTTKRSRLNTFIEEKDSPSSSKMSPRTSEVARLRKTIQWLEEGSRKLREELAGVRAELHEERRAAKVARQMYDAALRDTKSSEAAKHKGIISNLKARLSESPSRPSIDSASVVLSKTDSLKDEKHKREMAALRKRLAEAENTIQKLKANSLNNTRSGKKNKESEISKVDSIEMRKLDIEAQSLRAANKKLEEKLHIAEESARARAAELRMQHENHEAELSALQKALRSDTIKMIDEIQSKNREIEKLEKLVNASAQINEKLRTKEDETNVEDFVLENNILKGVSKKIFYQSNVGEIFLETFNNKPDHVTQVTEEELVQLSTVLGENKKLQGGVTFIEALPKTTTRKICKNVLKEMARTLAKNK